MMDMRTMPPIINSASSASVTGSAPQLGAMVPGTTGGMPAVSGLSVTQNPMAKQLQSYGRGDDKMLVHMTPGEVGGLQQLAMAHGGSLSINPQTGLPEAGFLSKLLPTLIGFGLAATGVGAPLAAGMVAAGQTALTGDLSKGLMAGLGAFGGAGLAGAAGVGGSLLGGNAGGLLGNNPGLFGAEMGFGAGAKTAASAIPGAGVGEAIKVTAQMPGAGALSAAAPEALTPAIQSAVQGPLSSQIANQAVNQAASNIGQVATQGLAQGAGQATANALPSGGLFSKFGGYTKQGLGGAPKILSKNAPMLAGIGALSSVAGAMQPSMPTYDEEEDEYKFEYKGPFVPGKREVSFQSDEDMRASGGAEYMGFTPSNPQPRRVADLTPEERAKYGFAEGGRAMIEPSSRFSDAILPSSSMIVPAELSAPRATRAAPPAFGDLMGSMDFFGATSPGAITASMRPTTPKQVGAGEEKYEFNKKANPIPPVIGGGAGGFGGFDFGNFDLSYLNDLNDRFGRMEQQVLNPDYSSINDRFGQLENRFGEQLMQLDSGLDDRFNQYDSQLNTMQDSITPALSGINDRFGQFESRFDDRLGQIDSGINNRFGQIESRFDTMPTTDFSGINDRLGQFENRFDDRLGQIDSGINNRFGQIESRFDTMPTTDFSGINDRLGQFESRFDDRLGQIDSGINNRFGQIESRFDTMPAPAATDLSGVYDRLGQFENRFDDRLGQIDSRFDTMPAPAATDLSGVYDRLGQIENRFDTMPATDFSGIYDRLGQIDSRFDTMPVQNDFRGFEQADQFNQFGQMGENFARGGEVDMRDGSFVVDARTVSELGNGSSNAGMELLARMGGRPLQGPGDGVSDSIRARIGGKQEARVARDEVLFSPDAVKRLGKGNEKRGTAKLYDLMNKAHKARKKAKRGQDTKVRKGLA
jgi:hypothetical protein